MRSLITLPAPCSFDTALTFDADGYFKRSHGQGAHSDAMRMIKGEKLHMPSMAAFWTELSHAENIALKAFSATETKHGVKGNHPEKTKASQAVERLSLIHISEPTRPY